MTCPQTFANATYAIKTKTSVNVDLAVKDIVFHRPVLGGGGELIFPPRISEVSSMFGIVVVDVRQASVVQ